VEIGYLGILEVGLVAMDSPGRFLKWNFCIIVANTQLSTFRARNKQAKPECSWICMWTVFLYRS